MVRLKNRYILCELIYDDGQPAAKPKISTFYAQRAIQEAVRQIHGDYGLGVTAAGFTVKYVGPQTNTVLIKVRHRGVKFVTSSLPFVKSIVEAPCCLQTLHIAGTIRACQKFLVRHDRRHLAILFKESKTKAEKDAVLDAIQKCAAKETVWKALRDDSDEDDDSDDDT